MESEKHRANDDVASDVAAGIEVLRRLVRGKHHRHGFKGIEVSVGPAKGGGEQEPGVIYCKVKIEGDTPGDRDKIKGKFPAKEGWTCTNTGDKTATCTNP
jgi:hypothetical protein